MAESQNIEYKKSWRDEYLKWICGFANARGGALVIGKDDSGNVVGIKNAKKFLEDIPNKVRDILGSFLFRGEEAEKYVRVLSGNRDVINAITNAGEAYEAGDRNLNDEVIRYIAMKKEWMNILRKRENILKYR